MSTYQQYLKEVRSEFGYMAAWPPSNMTSLGDVGGFNRKGVFEKRTSLAEIGITFDVEHAGGPIQLRYASKGTVDIQPGIEATGPAPAQSKAPGMTVDVKFSKSGAVLILSPRCTFTRISRLASLASEVERLDGAGRWEHRQVVVTEVATAETATILVSGESNAEAILSASLNLSAKAADIINLGADLRRIRSRGVAIEVVSETTITPMFRAHGLRRSWVGRREFTDAMRSAETEAICEVTPAMVPLSEDV